MKRRDLSQMILLFFLGLAFVGPMATGAAAENSCVSCHEKLKGERYKTMGHNFGDWKKSIHAQNGVVCEACHDGNPAMTDLGLAHQGVLPAKNPEASIYFQKIPETCGRCHTEELKEFKKSAHYKMLERNGKGPSCLTCHGSMATHLLSPADLDQTCSLCHGKPTRAAKALSLLRSLKKF